MVSYGEKAYSSEVIWWLDKDIDAYWRKRIYGLLDQVGTLDDTTLKQQWDNLMVELYGNNESGKQDLIKAALTDHRVSEKAREWLQR